MMRLELALLTAITVAAWPAVSAAQECPPGGWFCEGEEPTENAEAEAGENDGPEVVVVEADEVKLPDETDDDSPTVVVLTGKDDDDGPTVVVVGEDTEAPPPPEPVHRPFSEWGFNLRLQAALMGEDEQQADDAGMGGLGFSFRYRPVPHFAFDVGLDFLAGRDWHGYRRSETGMPFTGIIFSNPYDSVQAYALGGFHFSWAEVDVEQSDTIGGSVFDSTERRDYSYFGGHLGGGLEFRVGKKSALNVDLVGFIRGRTDTAAETEPEFVDAENPNLTTNTSGGGLLRGGVTFYW